jgi:hypothetical protein
MEQTNTENLFNSLVGGDMDDIQSSFETAIGEKLQRALEVRKVGLTADIFNEPAVNESADLTEAKLEEPKSKGDLADLLKKAKQIRGVSDDEYILWYGNLDMKMFDVWDKMVKKDPNYKKAYKLGYDGGSDKNPHKSGTLAAAIWDDQYATGAFDA